MAQSSLGTIRPRCLSFGSQGCVMGKEGIVTVGFTSMDSLLCPLLTSYLDANLYLDSLSVFPHLESWHALLILLLEDKNTTECSV